MNRPDMNYRSSSLNFGLKFLLLTMLATLPAVVLAQTSKEHQERPHQVVVTASRGVEQNPLDVPQAILNITSEKISEENYIDLDEAIREIPNVGLAPEGGNPNFWQEGFTIRGLGAQRVLTLSDGIRQAGQGIGYGGGNLSLYDLYSVERIEVLKSPASVLYGTDAFGGVINIITRNPKARTEFGTSGGVRYGWDEGYDQQKVGWFLDAGDETVAGVFGGSYTDSGRPELPDDETADNGSFRNLNFWGKADFNFTRDTKLRLTANSNLNKDILVADRSMTLPIATFPPPGSSVPITGPLFFNIPTYHRAMAGAELTTEDISDCWKEFRAGFAWQWIGREFHRESLYYPLGTPGFSGPPTFVIPAATVTSSTVNTDDTMNTYEWYVQSVHEYDEHKVTWGVDVGYDTSDLPENESLDVLGAAGIGAVDRAPVATDRIRAKANQVRLGLYAQDNIALGDFEVTPGARFDHFIVNDDESDFDEDLSGFSGSIGTLYHVSNRNSIYLTTATGFRAPDLGERFQEGLVNLGGPNLLRGKSDLDPERSYSADLGTKYQGEMFDGELGGFVNHIDDYIGIESLGVINGISTEEYSNVGSLDLYGVETMAAVKPIENGRLYVGISRTFTNSPTKIDVRDWVFQYGVGYKLPLNNEYLSSIGARFDFRTYTQSEDKTSIAAQSANTGNPGIYDAFTVADLKFNFELLKNSWGKGMLVSGIKNLFDENYREPFFNVNQPARHFFVSLEYQF